MELTELKIAVGAQTHSLQRAQESFRIGSGPDNDLVVAGPQVAEHHLTIDHEGSAWVVRPVDGSAMFSGDQAIAAASIPGPTTLALGAADGPRLHLAPASAAPVAASDPGLYLRTEEGDDRIFSNGQAVVVGSDQACDFVVQDALVAPQHVRFEFGTTGWTLTDLGSTRGTYVDGRRVTGTVPATGSFLVRLADRAVGPELAVVSAGEHSRPLRRGQLIIGAVAALALLIAVVAAVVAATRDGEEEFPPLADVVPSVVYLECPFTEGGKEYVSRGSGTVIDDGLVLTNFHVAYDSRCETFTQVAAGSSEDRATDSELFGTELVAYDEDLDLAVLRVVGDFDQPALEIGDSDDVETGVAVRTLGYPSVGGLSITVTDGIVSGRSSASEAGGPWIKTDASTAGGNSGGTVIDTDGRLIGVPTMVTRLRCEAPESTVLCDGYSLGLVRPISEAAGVIADARSDPTPVAFEDLGGGTEPTEPTEPEDEAGSIRNLRFGGKGEDGKIIPADDQGVLSSTASPNACAWFDAVDVSPGTTYDLTADIAGKRQTGTFDDVDGGDDTINWCFAGAGGGTPPTGAYEFTVAIQGRPDTQLQVSGTYE